jgi:hypothetical protein
MIWKRQKFSCLYPKYTNLVVCSIPTSSFFSIFFGTPSSHRPFLFWVLHGSRTEWTWPRDTKHKPLLVQDELIMGACRNSFFSVFLLFLAKFMLQSSFFSESKSFTRPLFWFFVPDLDRLAGQLIQIFFAIQIFVLFCSRFFMYSSVGSILWEATLGKLAAGEVDGRG